MKKIANNLLIRIIIMTIKLWKLNILIYNYLQI